MLIFDIGGNIGNFSLKKLQQNKNDFCVIVEPLHKHILIMKHTLQKYKERIKIYESAVSNNNRSIDYYECSNTNGKSGAESCSTCSLNHIQHSCFGGGEQGNFMMKDGKTFSEHYYFKEPIQVTTITLDKLVDIHGNPDLIKIDVEGYENNVLKSLTKKSATKITFEWHEYNIDTIIDSIRYLHSIGYRHFSTEMWYEGKFEHNNEIEDYKSCDDFIAWFESIIRQSISMTGNLDKKTFKDPWNKNKKTPYINLWGMIWVK